MTGEPQPQPRPLTGGAVMSAASRVTVAVTGAGATILVARMLGPDGAGGFAIAQSLILTLTVATTLGVEHGITYYVGSGRWAARDAHRSAQRVAVLSGLVGAGLGVLARLIVPAAFGNLSIATTAVAAGALPFALSWFYFSYVALAIDRYEGYALPPAFQSTIALVLIGGLGVAFDLRGAVLGVSLAHVVTAIAVSVAVGRTLRSIDASPGERGQLRRAIRFGVKGYAANALQFVNLRIDVFILAAMATSAEVGHYSVAVAVTSVMLLLPRSLSEVLFPRVAALSARSGEDSAQARAFVEAKTLRHAVLVVAVAVIVLAGAIVLLVVPVFGAPFRPAITLGLILLPGIAFLGVAGPLSASVIGRGRPGLALAVNLVTTPLTLVLYATLIPAFEATGAALASSISYVATFALWTVTYRRVTGIAVVRSLVPTRSEFADYQALVPAIGAWAGRVRASRHARQP